MGFNELREQAAGRQMNHTVGVADMKVSPCREDVLITYALGSCLGISVFDPAAGVGGLLHCMLPSGKMDPDQARDNPYKFVESGVPALFRKVYELGGRKERMILKVCGGARVLDNTDYFKIGQRNYATLRKILWKNNVPIDGEEVGGAASCTMFLELATGRVTVRINGRVIEV